MAQTLTKDTVLKGSEALQSPGQDQVWGINSSNLVLRSAGSNLVKIAVNAGQDWGINVWNQIFKLIGEAWIQQRGPEDDSAFVEVAVGSDGQVWALLADHTVLKWNGSSFDPAGSNLVKIAVNAGQAWGINVWNQIFKSNGKEWVMQRGPKDDSAFVEVAVGSDGQVWALLVDHTVLKWNDSKSSFDPAGSDLVTIAANGGQAWGIDVRKQVVAWNDGLNKWDLQASGPFVSVAVGPNLQVWAIGPDHSAFAWNGLSFNPTGLQFVTLAIG